MKILFLILALALGACTDKPDTEFPGSPSKLLHILFEDGDGPPFTDIEKELIHGIIIESEAKVRSLLPSLPTNIEIAVAQIERNIDTVGGVTGRANAPGKILLQLSSTFPGGVSGAAEAALALATFHELHHLFRGWTIQDNKFGPGIAIAAVNEGLASVFSEEFTGVYFPESYGYPDDVDQWLEEILALPADASYSDWVGGIHPDGRDAIGYRVGRYIVHQATASSGQSVLDLGDLTPDEILTLAGAR